MKLNNVKIYENVDDTVVGNILAEAECNHYGFHGKIKVLVYEEGMYIFSINKIAIVEYKVGKMDCELELKVAYTEEDYKELKKNYGYKENYIEHIIRGAANNAYDYYREKKKK